MIRCSICKIQTLVPINSEAICFECYDERIREQYEEMRQTRIDRDKEMQYKEGVI